MPYMGWSAVWLTVVGALLFGNAAGAGTAGYLAPVPAWLLGGLGGFLLIAGFGLYGVAAMPGRPR
jgi:hypothetical protein